MGFSASWLAVRGRTRNAVLATLGLEASGEFEEVPESPVTGVTLPDGWFLVYANDFDFAARASLAALSAGAEVVTCAVEEHVMVSSAAGWGDGRATWSVVHDSRHGISHLKVSGRLPPHFPAIRDRLLGKQESASDVDYVFDVPVALAFTLTGFRHDQYLGDRARFERLR